MPAKSKFAQSLVDARTEPFALIDEAFNIVAHNRVYAEGYTHLDTNDIVGMKCE